MQVELVGGWPHCMRVFVEARCSDAVLTPGLPLGGRSFVAFEPCCIAWL